MQTALVATVQTVWPKTQPDPTGPEKPGPIGLKCDHIYGIALSVPYVTALETWQHNITYNAMNRTDGTVDKGS